VRYVKGPLTVAACVKLQDVDINNNNNNNNNRKTDAHLKVIHVTLNIGWTQYSVLTA